MVGCNQAPAAAQPEVRVARTERAVAGIAWATEAYRQAPAVPPEAEVAPSAGYRVEREEKARERAVREALPAWELPAPEVVVDAAGNQP